MALDRRARDLSLKRRYRSHRDANIADTLDRADGTDLETIDARCFSLIDQLFTLNACLLRTLPARSGASIPFSFLRISQFRGSRTDLNIDPSRSIYRLRENNLLVPGPWEIEHRYACLRTSQDLGASTNLAKVPRWFLPVLAALVPTQPSKTQAIASPLSGLCRRFLECSSVCVIAIVKPSPEGTNEAWRS